MSLDMTHVLHLHFQISSECCRLATEVSWLSGKWLKSFSLNLDGKSFLGARVTFPVQNHIYFHSAMSRLMYKTPFSYLVKENEIKKLRNTQGKKLYNSVQENNINNKVIGGLYTTALVFQHKLAGNSVQNVVFVQKKIS